MHTALLRCPPNAAFHFGKFSAYDDTALNDTATHLPSDTLFGALVTVFNDKVQTEKQSTDAFVSLFRDGQIRLSSGFLCLEKDNRFLFFLPKLATTDMAAGEANINHKQLKKVAYVSADIWEQNITADHWAADCITLGGLYVCTKTALAKLLGVEVAKIPKGWNENLKLTQLHTRAHVSVRSDDDATRLYYTTNLWLTDLKRLGVRSHLYFLYNFDSQIDNTWKTLFETTIKLLAGSGVGGERSVGCATFESVTLNMAFEYDCKNSNAFGSVSLWIPNDTDNLADARYQTEMRGGRWISSTDNYRLKQVRTIREGAVTATKSVGCLADISPDNNTMGVPFLRHGLPLVLGIRTEKLRQEIQ
jgi:CRISPR type III-A-associated RAMP protein Csm4